MNCYFSNEHDAYNYWSGMRCEFDHCIIDKTHNGWVVTVK